MAKSAIDLDLNYQPEPSKSRLGIGLIGAGFIMRDVHMAAYNQAGYNLVGIASRTKGNAQSAADQWGLTQVYESVQDLLNDPKVEIVDVAYPPHLQLEIVREAVKHNDHIKGILAQKPLATNLKDAREMVKLCEDAGIVLSINQNM